MTLLLSNYPSH